MKVTLKYLILACVFFFFGVSSLQAAVYYVDSNGSNLRDGSKSAPWRTIAYALSKAKSGDTISINNGLYSEGSLFVPEGVNLTSTSQDKSKVIIQPNTFLASNRPLLSLDSTLPGSNGQQSVSHITLNGDAGPFKSRVGISVKNRNNVKITHCDIKNFTGGSNAFGVYVRSTEIAYTSAWARYWPTEPQAPGIEKNIDALWPDNPVENFELSYCTITNCGYRKTIDSGTKYGAVRPFHLKNSIIHHNTINTVESYGQPIKAVCAFMDNVDIYNNNLIMAHFPGYGNSVYAIELWLHRRGCEYYNNKANGMFSITFGKETKIYNNTIIPGWSMQLGRGQGIEFIGQSEGEVYNNYVEKAGAYGISVGLETYGRYDLIVRNTKVYDNIIYKSLYSAISIRNDGSDSIVYKHTLDNIDVFRNICDGKSGSSRSGGQIEVRAKDGAKGRVINRNIKIYKNILINGTGYAGKTEGVVSNLVLNNNLYWKNYKNSWSGSNATNTKLTEPKFTANGSRPDYYKFLPNAPLNWEIFPNKETPNGDDPKGPIAYGLKIIGGSRQVAPPSLQ